MEDFTLQPFSYKPRIFFAGLDTTRCSRLPAEGANP
jgi:hypothetical protein